MVEGEGERRDDLRNPLVSSRSRNSLVTAGTEKGKKETVDEH